MVVRRTLLVVTTAGSLAVASLAGTVAFAQQEGPAPSGVTDDALLERLDALEQDLPGDVAPTGVSIERTGEEGDATGGTFDGDVTGQAAIIDTLAGDLTSLYVDADDGTTAVADAVADVARGWLDLGEGSTQLAVWEGHDLQFPLDASDDEDVAAGADELRGRVEAGMRLVLGAQRRNLGGYVALRDLGQAEPAAQTRFDARASSAVAFDEQLAPRLRQLLSLRTTQVLATTDRFETSAPGSESRARSMTVTCIDREAYADASLELGTTEDGRPGAPALGESLPSDTTRVDCPDLPPGGAETR